MTQLVDLVGKHLDLDYVYDPNIFQNRSVVVKLHGTAKGDMKIKDLYSVLEIVLKSQGLAMIRREGKLATIVPVDKSLDADPDFVDMEGDTIKAGNVVVTCIFELEHVTAASVKNLLQNMKLGVAISTLEDAQVLLVTCYAHRMSRIEQLVDVLDRPGEPTECWIRSLQYTVASALTEKLKAAVSGLRNTPLEIVSVVGPSSVSQGTKSESLSTSKSEDFAGHRSDRYVYLDKDERTNRLLMIGHAEQLSILEQLVEALDTAERDRRAPKIYEIKHMNAQEALSKLYALRIIDQSAVAEGKPRIGASSTFPSSQIDRISNNRVLDESLAVVLGMTNKLLVRATKERHARIREFLNHIDVAHEDLRTLQLYNIHHVEAEEVKSMLSELGMIGAPPAGSPRIAAPGSTKPKDTMTSRTESRSIESIPTEELQVVVAKSVNSLLVNATADMHIRIATIVDYVDNKVPEEEMSYAIYPLENSSPRHVADILQQLIQENIRDKEGKIEKGLDNERHITIVPDPNTFSLVVHANKKEQDWIESLIERLDKRRPQVLIDVTLVEITRTDTFEYDLNLVASAQKAVVGNIVVPPIHQVDSTSRLEGAFDQLDRGGNRTGELKVFYSDEKVQMLLTAIRTKNYGRILAKPKILVDDGQQGSVSTTDETTYVRESIQVPNQGSPITTRGFETIEASIQLQITPHISEGDLLRLDVHLSREDFGARPLQGGPPDKVRSELTTTVFVPDSHTVILGGLVKLNQTKAVAKVPILGDIPLLGALFRDVDNSDFEKKLYVFLKANMVRPSEETGLADLQKVSKEQRKAFEESEAEFQEQEDIPGIKPRPMRPKRVLDDP